MAQQLSQRSFRSSVVPRRYPSFLPSKYSYLAEPESCLLLRRTRASPSQGPSPCSPRGGCSWSLWQWGKSWSTDSPGMVRELSNAARFCHRAQQEVQGELSTQAHLQFLICSTRGTHSSWHLSSYGIQLEMINRSCLP